MGLSQAGKPTATAPLIKVKASYFSCIGIRFIRFCMGKEWCIPLGSFQGNGFLSLTAYHEPSILSNSV